MCLLAICIFSSVKCLFRSFVHFLTGCLTFYGWVLRVLYMYWSFGKVFSKPTACLFIPLIGCFAEKKKIWLSPIYHFCYFMDCAVGVNSKNSASLKISKIFSSFFPKSFIVVRFTLKFRNHFESVLHKIWNLGWKWIGFPIVPGKGIERISFHHWIAFFSLSNQLGIFV